MSGFFASVSAFFAQQEMLLFVLLAGVILVAILLVAWIIHRAAKRAEAMAEIAKGEAPMAEPKGEGGEHGHRPGGLFARQKRSFAGWLQVRRAFNLGLEEYRRFVAHSRNYYLVPWYLVLGEIGSGKSRILDSVGPNRPPVYLADAESQRPIGCTWWFYDEATVIEAAGEYITTGSGARASQRGFSTLLNRMRVKRPQRPVDGVVLAVPVGDLVGPNRLPAHELRQKARDLYARLFLAQGTLGLSLPIYIVLTHCDRLVGFDSFAEGLPDRLQDGMFGWSNPYPLEVPFAATWLDEAFDTISGDLLKLHIELHAGGRSQDTGDDIFTFASGLREIQEPLAELLTTIFRRSAYHETFYFRGVYMTGDLAAAAEEEEAEEEALLRTQPATAGLPARIEPVFTPGEHGHVVFARDLFMRKIFAERDLAKFTPASALGFRRRRIAYRVVTAALAAFVLLMVWNDYQRASLWSATMQPTLADLPDVIRTANDSVAAMSREGDSGKPSLAAKRAVATFLDDVAGLEDPFTSLLLPGSWFDPVQDNARTALQVGYYNAVLVPLRASLDRRMQALVAGKGDGDHPGGEVEAFTAYVHDIRTVEAAAQVYNRLNGSNSLRGLPTLIRYTYGLSLTPAFIERAVRYDIATAPASRLLRASELAPVAMANYHDAANQRLAQLADAAFARLADGSLVASRLRLVADNLSTAMTPGQNLPGITTALQNALAGLHDATTQVNADNDFWTGQRALVFSPGMNDALDQIAQSSLFDQGMRDKLVEKARLRFAAMQQDYRLVNSPIGPLIARDADGTATLSPAAIALMSALDTWFSQDFMQPSAMPDGFGSPSAPVVWDTSTLATAPNMIEHYLLFSSKSLGQVPPALQPIVKAVSLAQLQFNLLNTVAAARHPTDTTFTPGAGGQDGLRQRITSLNAAAPVLGDIMQAFRQFALPTAYDRLHGYVRGQALSLLTSVDDIARGNQYFLPLPAVLQNWQGTLLTNFQMFGMTDPASLGQYLDTSRQYYASLVRGMAAPILDVVRRFDSGNGGSALVDRWSQTVADLDKFDAHAPDSSLSALNRFVTVDLASIDLTQCGKLASTATPLFASDIFAVRLSQIQSMVLSRCQAIIGQQAFTAYDAITAAFQRDFSGLFPFAAVGNPDTTPDAAADFYQTFDQYAPAVANALKKAPQYFLSAPRVAVFIEAMQQARDFLLPNDPTQDRPSVTLDIRVRSNREAESGGNQIIEWRLASGSAAFDSLTNASPLVWHYGDPLQLSLRWAKDSEVSPIIIGKSVGGAQVDDRTLQYSFDGNWSLIAMMRLLGAEPSLIGRATGTRSVLQINFDTRPAQIPPDPKASAAASAAAATVNAGAVPTSPGRVFMSLVLRQGSPATGTGGAHWITLPVFPRVAPALTTISSQGQPYMSSSQALDMSALSAILSSFNTQGQAAPGAMSSPPTMLTPGAVDQLNQN